MEDSGKPAPEMGGEKLLWQDSGVVDRFEGQGHRKLTEQGSLWRRQSRRRGTGGGSKDRWSKRLTVGSGAARCCT
jgi:hypothetical protein